MSTEMENRSGAGTILNKIRQKAEAEVQAIHQDSEEKADALRAAILKEADKRAKEILATAEKNASQVRQSSRQQATLSARIAQLDQKHRCLDEVCTCAKEAMQNLDDAQWAVLFTKLVLETPIPGEVEVRVPQQDAARYKDPAYCDKYLSGYQVSGSLLEGWGTLLTQRYQQSHTLRLAEEYADIDGGLLLCGKEYDLNLSFDALLTELFESHEKEIADILFTADGSCANQ